MYSQTMYSQNVASHAGQEDCSLSFTGSVLPCCVSLQPLSMCLLLLQRQAHPGHQAMAQ